MLFLCIAVVFFGAFGVPQLVFMVRRRKLVSRDWSELVASIEPINLAGVTAIAEMFLQPTKYQLHLEPPAMWQMLGGLKGLQQLSRNAETMLELCVYTERWDFQGPLIAEMIRLDLANLKKALLKVELATLYGIAHVRGHFALMEVAVHYHLIRLRLLGQYEKSHVARLPSLQARLGA